MAVTNLKDGDYCKLVARTQTVIYKHEYTANIQ
jgi:hypothetical protein